MSVLKVAQLIRSSR